MDDTLVCPVCGNKLKNIKMNGKFLHDVNKSADYIERRCNEGRNHSLMFFVDDSTKCVDLLKISLSPNYSKFLEINYVDKTCRISCWADGNPEYIKIDKMIEPDFPELIKLKEKVSVYILFS